MAASSSTISTEPAEDEGISTKLRRATTASSDIYSLPGQREIQVEGGSFSGTALHANLSCMLLDDAVSYRKAQPCSAALAFRGHIFSGEKWIVDTVDMFLRYTRAGIRHGNAHALSVGGADAQNSSIRHGVFRIQKQVEKHLLQAPGIALNVRQLIGQVILHCDLAGFELVLQQRQRVGDDLVDLHVGELGSAGT